MKRKILTILLAVILYSCTDDKSARKVLSSQGYTDIVLTGYECFECSEDDFYSTGFIAKSITGEQVEGVVCGGLFKSQTIRLK